MIKVSYSMEWQSHVISFRLPDARYPAFSEKMEALCKNGAFSLGTVECEPTKENLALVAAVINDYIYEPPKAPTCKIVIKDADKLDSLKELERKYLHDFLTPYPKPNVWSVEPLPCKPKSEESKHDSNA